MAQSAAGETEHLATGREGPAIIAHGGGNALDSARGFVAAGADFLEVDLWLHRGRLEARHERRVRFLPLLVERWYLRRVPHPHYGFAELLSAVAGSPAGIFLDLKNGGIEAVAALEQAVAATPAPPRLVASSQQWSTLRALSFHLPTIETFYSVDVSAKLDLFRAVADRDSRPRGISCRHTLLTEPVVRELASRGLLVVAWTVDDPHRARQLVDWGVHGITTHRVAEMRAEFVPRP